VGVGSSALTLLAWRTERTSRLATLLSGAWIVGGALPGVLVGSLVGRAWNTSPRLDLISQGIPIVVFAHLARVGFLAILLGRWLAWTEPAETRDQCLLDGAHRGLGWFHASVRPRLFIALAGGVCAGALSLHEIEATNMVVPPGVPLLARKILSDLHFLRTQEMASGVLNVFGATAVLAVLAMCTPRLRNRPAPEGG
jgi:ABC-type spermidine/putrescine transport system permease subunit II